MIYPETFEVKTGFSGIRETLSGYCLSDLGRGHLRRMEFLTSHGDIELRLRQTDEMRRIHLFGDQFPVGFIADASPGLRKLRVEGAFMEIEELFDLKRSLDTARALLNFFRGRNIESYPGLTALADASPMPRFVSDRLSSLFTREGGIRDNASPELASIRRTISRQQAEVSRRLHSLLKEAQSGGLAEGDAGLAIRNGRPVIPVSASLKRRIPGLIHDESASGKTVYIEPAEVVELNNGIRELEYAERREVLRILKEVSGSLVPYLQELLLVFRFLGLVDFIRAKAMFAIKTGAVMPIVRDRPFLNWENAIHPLLYLALKKEGRPTVPLDITLDDENRILVISGPNAGGKSVCLQTVGLLQYMLQCGMLVPLSENSEAGIFSGIFIDIGDEQSIENDLSTYSSHLLNMKFFIRNAGERTLILIDEFGAGTEPMLGGAIAESILERLNRCRTRGVITTHYTNLKHYAASADGIFNGAMLFDTGKMEPLFRLEAGKPGSSFAFEIARKIGLPEEILSGAASRVGEEHIDFDRHLKDVIRDKQYWERKRRNIRQVEKKLEQDLEKYVLRLEAAEKEKKEIISAARQEARQLLEGVNRKIENTIRQIKESQAEKEKTLRARKELSELRKQVDQDTAADTVDAGGKLSRLRARQEKLRRKGEKKDEAAPGKKTSREPAGKGISKGDHVVIEDRGITGEVLDVSGKTVMVAFGNMITTTDIKKLRKLSRDEIRESPPAVPPAGARVMFDLRQKKLTFRPEKDVRGMRADEAIEVVESLIDDAVMVNAGQVRILHGKGNGILRQLIREYLATVPVVASFRDEHVEFGGSGITIVELGNF
jgi:DNA mismatch repair protein MutS2